MLIIVWPRSTPGTPPACAILVDIDQSTVEVPGLIDDYRSWSRNEIERCAAEVATLVAAPATPDSETTAVLPVVAELGLASDDRTGNATADKAKTLETAESTIQQVDGLIADAVKQNRRGGTDIIGALVVIGQQLDPDRNSDCRLTMFTDGINTKNPNLTAVPLDQTGIDATLTRLRQQHRLPQLHQCQVAIIGAGIGRFADELDPGRLQSIRRFWEQLIRASGGRLDSWNKTPNP